MQFVGPTGGQQHQAVVSFYKGTFIPVQPVPQNLGSHTFSHAGYRKHPCVEVPKPDEIRVNVTRDGQNRGSQDDLTGKTKMELVTRVVQLERQLKWRQSLVAHAEPPSVPLVGKGPKITLAQKFDKFCMNLVTQVKALQMANVELGTKLEGALKEIDDLKIKVSSLEDTISKNEASSRNARASSSSSLQLSEASTAPSTGTPPNAGDKRKVLIDDLLPEEEEME